MKPQKYCIDEAIEISHRKKDKIEKILYLKNIFVPFEHFWFEILQYYPSQGKCDA